MLAHWVWLSTRKNLEDNKRVALLRQFETAEKIYETDPQILFVKGAVSPSAMESLMDRKLGEAEEILERCDRQGISILTYRDARYPERLKSLDDGPCLLYYRGRLPEIDELPVISMVGTRQASAYGLTMAKRIGYQISQGGGIVASGMAVGIDSASIQGALTAGGPVIGVLGCGADVVYPKSNWGLYEDVLRYGCLLSEFPPGTPPYRNNFPQRNRVLSGISCGVLVVEAPRRSGALITAQAALDQGRDVFVVPGNVDVPSCAGSNGLLRQGAAAVGTGYDVLDEYAYRFRDRIQRDKDPFHRMPGVDTAAKASREEAGKNAAGEPAGKKSHENGKLPIDTNGKPPYSDQIDRASVPVAALSPNEKAIVNVVGKERRLVDDVILDSGLSTGDALAAITLLEVKGVVSLLPGSRIERAGNQS